MPSEDPSSRAGVPALVRDLVSQFDRPLDFLRELMQNSIDAGANRIDISLSFDGERAVISVEDDGEGMDRAVIDASLLSLFLSGKEGDFTKIGRFGVGFVSVFALEPDRVRLFTGRDGDCWAVDFEDVGRGAVSEADEMREGTRVEVEKRMDGGSFAELAVEARFQLRRWAGHSEARVFLEVSREGGAPESEELSAPFSMEGASLEYREEGTEILMAFTAEPVPYYAFYNRGLLLKDGRRSFFKGVRFKAKSRYLKHDLTRADVLQDGDYEKLMSVAARLVREELPGLLRKELEELARRPAARGKLAELWESRAASLDPESARNWEIFPLLDGRAFSARRLGFGLGKADGRLLYDSETGRVSEGFAKEDVHAVADGPWVRTAAEWLGVPPVRASRAYICPKTIRDRKLEPAMRGLLASLRAADAAAGARFAGFMAAEGAGGGRLFALQEVPGGLSPADASEKKGPFGLGRVRRWAVLYSGHPAARALAGLHLRDPRKAAFLASMALGAESGGGAGGAAALLDACLKAGGRRA